MKRLLFIGYRTDELEAIITSNESGNTFNTEVNDLSKYDNAFVKLAYVEYLEYMENPKSFKKDIQDTLGLEDNVDIVNAALCPSIHTLYDYKKIEADREVINISNSDRRIHYNILYVFKSEDGTWETKEIYVNYSIIFDISDIRTIEEEITKYTNLEQIKILHFTPLHYVGE